MKIIAGNWKMNSGYEENRQRLKDIAETACTDYNKVIVFPPFISLKDAVDLTADSDVEVGAQNCYPGDFGAYTGEISGEMLKELGCAYCLVGHSERRQYFKEDDDFLKAKIVSLWEKGIVPVFCVGETLEQREAGRFCAVLTSQLKKVLAGLEVTKDNLIIAYEPVWAIGTGVTATPEQANEAMAFIRRVLKESKLPDDLYLLYGGSAKPGNAEELLSEDNIDGLLIGGASLKPQDFAAMTKCRGK